MTASTTADIVEKSSTIVDTITAENATPVSPGTTALNVAQNSTNTESAESQEDNMDSSNITISTITAPSVGDLDAGPIIANPEPSNPELPTEVPIAIPAVEEEKPTLNIDSSVPKSEPTSTSPRPKGMAEPKTPRRLEGLNSFELPSEADSERRSGWRPVKRQATHTFAGQPSDHASFPTRPTHVGNVPNSARPGTDTEKTHYTLSATLDRRERELDRHERELDRRERELERMERELERRRRDFEQDRTRWETQTQMESYLQAVAQPQINKPAPSQETFPAQWQTALESFKKSLQAQITLERREAESALEARILRRVNDELAKERKMQEVMQMSDKEVNELMEDTVGHWLRKVSAVHNLFEQETDAYFTP
ncbi:hypothetical protein BJ165DRAFT_1488559 [Panaeolus papilionaceus]|nr:hypothetical protein BJ165DRAFT_1488559 [Panaeolus papilionaceus]